VKATELRDLPLEELRSKEKDTQEALFNLRFQQATGLLENSMRVPTTKKDLARIKTILREKITAQQNR
jgi:large subunit ribosomal protein L29